MAKITITYPSPGLVVSISVKDRDTGIEEFSGVMTEISKVYKYDFIEVAGVDYIYVASCTGYDDMTGVIYSESTTSGGLTTEEHDKLMNITGGGGFSINYQAINSHTTKKANEVIEEIKKSKTDLSGIENTLNEISSQNDIANNNIIDTIKETGIEVSSDVIRKSKELETSNVKTRNLVRQNTKKIDENVSKLSDRQDLTDKKIEDEADEIEEQIEKILEQEADMIENEINTQFEREADEIESNLS